MVFTWLEIVVSGFTNLHHSVVMFRNCLIFGCASATCCLTSKPHRVGAKPVTWFSSSSSGIYLKSVWLSWSPLTIPAKLDVVESFLHACMHGFLLNNTCLAFQRTASRWPGMQCFTWALTAPRRTIFSRSGTMHGHHEADNDVWNVCLVWDFYRSKSVSVSRAWVVWY